MRNSFECQYHVYKYTRNISTALIVLLLSLSLWQLAAAGWIQGKAIIAQQLLNYSWQRTRINPRLTTPERSDHKGQSAGTDESAIHKPWPWADTWPVAKLIVPQHGIEQIVLAGDSGNSLAFAPGYSLASAEPNSFGTTVISAHRDTHFQFLKDLEINDTIYLETVNDTMRYSVNDMQVVDSKTHVLQDDTTNQTLVLVTCYPFDAIMSGGALRYIVYATRSMTQH